MQIKKLSSFIVPPALLAAAAIYFLITVDFGNHAASGPAGAVSSEYSTNDSGVLDALYKKIEKASSPAQFEAIAYEVMDKAPDEHMNRLMERVLERWIKKDMAAALNFVSNLEEESIRVTLLRHTLVEGGYLDFRRVMDWIGRQSESKRQELFNMFYEGVAEENPEYALRYIDLLNEGEGKERILRGLIEQWAQQDIVAALSWMNAQTLTQAFDDLKKSLLSLLMKQNPQEAGTLIRDMQAGHEKNTVARNYADMIARTDIQTAANWARSLDDADSYRIALTAVYEAWFQKEPDKKLIMEQVLAESDSDLRDRLINEIALDIADSNPADLADMVERLPETSQPDVAEKAARFWKERDPRQVLTWVNSLPPGPVRDRASKVMVEDFFLRGDKESALSLAATILDKGVRFESIRNAAQYWYQTNPAEAQQTLDGISFLSELEKETITSHIQKTQR